MKIINIFKRFLPKKFKRKIITLLRDEFTKSYIEYNKKIPKYQLREKNFKNLKAVSNREDLLRMLPKNGIVAEIGVYKGDFSKKILNITTPQKLHLIDNWGSKRYPKELQKIVKNKFKEEIINNKVEINTGLSIEVANSFKDNYFDWVYIDTTHTYETTKNELERYSKKVKYDGIIAGHDFIIGNWSKIKKYGVIEAVYEFCVKNNWELIYLTMDCLYEFPSFAIRRIEE